MVIGSFTQNRKNKYWLILVIVVLFGCVKHENKTKTEFKINLNEVQNGLLICRLGNGFFSNYFRKYASKEQKYSHVGIISIENDSVFVYHTEASELTGIGLVKRELLLSFLQDIEVFDFFEFDYPNSTKEKILNCVKVYYNKKVPFDLDFDSNNDNALYCSELIACSINNAMDSAVIKPSLILNKKTFYALDDIYMHERINKFHFKD